MNDEKIIELSKINDAKHLLGIYLEGLRSLDCCEYCVRKGLKSCSYCIININFDLHLKLRYI